MTEQETEDENEVSDPIKGALEATGNVEPEGSEETQDASDAKSKVGGLVGKVGDLQGSGKSLSAYEEDPIASIWEDDGDVPKGALHIARGVDGLSPLGSAHPLIDIGVGFVLLKAEGEMRSRNSDDSSDEDTGNPGDDDIDSMGDMVT